MKLPTSNEMLDLLQEHTYSEYVQNGSNPTCSSLGSLLENTTANNQYRYNTCQYTHMSIIII